MFKSKKTIICAAVIVCVCAAVLMSAFCSPRRAAERVFRQNEAALNQMVSDYLAGDMQALKREIDGVSDVDFYTGEHAMIEFFVKGRGIAPASVYYGFYYSPDGVPLAFQNAKNGLVPSGNGWEWKAGGDNRGYTEQISGNWYYYEASF